MATANVTTVNGSETIESPTDFLEYRIAKWLWLYIAPGLLVIGVAGTADLINVRNKITNHIIAPVH